MAKINLLPWRLERRKQREREFYGMLGLAAVVGVLLSLLIWFYYDRQVSGQNARNAYLQAEIDKVMVQNKEIDSLDEQKRRLLARKHVIDELQAKRSQMVHLFDSLVRTIPDGVVLTSLKQEGDILTLEGRAQSNARVSTYMRNLEGSGWMSKPELSVIEAKPQDKTAKGLIADAKALPYVFTLSVRLPVPGDSADAAPGDAGPASGAKTLVPASDAKKTAAPAAAPAGAVAAPMPGGASHAATATSTQQGPAA